jgi:hypothetical protein
VREAKHPIYRALYDALAHHNERVRRMKRLRVWFRTLQEEVRGCMRVCVCVCVCVSFWVHVCLCAVAHAPFVRVVVAAQVRAGIVPTTSSHPRLMRLRNTLFNKRTVDSFGVMVRHLFPLGPVTGQLPRRVHAVRFAAATLPGAGVGAGAEVVFRAAADGSLIAGFGPPRRAAHDGEEGAGGGAASPTRGGRDAAAPRAPQLVDVPIPGTLADPLLEEGAAFSALGQFESAQAKALAAAVTFPTAYAAQFPIMRERDAPHLMSGYDREGVVYGENYGPPLCVKLRPEPSERSKYRGLKVGGGRRAGAGAAGATSPAIIAPPSTLGSSAPPSTPAPGSTPAVTSAPSGGGGGGGGAPSAMSDGGFAPNREVGGAGAASAARRAANAAATRNDDYTGFEWKYVLALPLPVPVKLYAARRYEPYPPRFGPLPVPKVCARALVARVCLRYFVIFAIVAPSVEECRAWSACLLIPGVAPLSRCRVARSAPLRWSARARRRA